MSRPSRENIYRACYPSVEVRGEFGTDSPPMLVGHFSVFDTPTEISSVREGNFIESVAPGAFKKTFAENRDQMKVLFQHGRDPQIGDKPIAKILDLREDDIGAYYEASLFPGLDPLVEAGLRAGAYGASFRFQVMRESVTEKPGVSASNPRGIPERVIREAQVAELGPVTWGAYKEATAGIRSITDTIHDVDALAYAGAIVFDDERMKSCEVFISRGIEPDKDGESTLQEFVPADGPPSDPSDESAPTPVALAEPRSRVQQLREDVAELRAMAMPMTDMPAMDPGQVNDTPVMTMLDDDTCEALGSLIEVIESTCEAMESLLGIDDDTTPDADDATGSEMNSTTPTGTVRSDSLESVEKDAPPSDSAEPSEAHPIRGRRDKQKSYLRKETPSWQL